jgi:MYXO-CTERM domain-containing protein
MHKLKLIGWALAAAISTVGAQAAQVTSAAGLTGPLKTITFDGYDVLTTTGPVNVGAEVGEVVTFTSSPNATLGANTQDLGSNGTWYDLPGNSTTVDGKFLASAFIATRGEFGFTFATPVASVGAFFNQFQVNGSTNSMLLIAYDAYGNDLESYRFSIDTDEFGYNEGQFLGFKRDTADIYGFGIADGTFVLDNLSFTTPVPEAGTWALMLAGFGVLAGLRRRRGN